MKLLPMLIIIVVKTIENNLEKNTGKKIILDVLIFIEKIFQTFQQAISNTLEIN